MKVPKESISIYLSVRDGASQVLSLVGDKTKALDKETQQLAQHTAALEKNNKSLTTRQGQLKSALNEANKKVKEAQKAYNEYGDELSRSALDDAIEKQAALKTELSGVETQIKANKKTYSDYVESLRKAGSGSGSEDGGLSSLVSGLKNAGLTKMLGEAGASALGWITESAIGQPTASAVSSVLSGAVSGAATGAVAGLPGILAGLGIGAVSGLISGGTQIFEAQDDAFKDYYQGLFDTVTGDVDSMIESGSTIAGSREQTQKAFAQRLGGDEEADAYLERVKTMAAQTNYAYDEITRYSKLLLNTYDPDEVFGVLQTLSDATAGLNLSSSDVEVMISGLSRMRTTGKTTQEYLNYFSERGVDVYSALGNALGVDKSKIAGMVTDGDISGETAAAAILDFIDQTYGGLSEDLMSTYDAMADNLEDVMSNVEAAGGEGYNEERKAGLQAEAEAYEGALGDAVSAINRIAGENQAYFENLQEQITRETLLAVLEGATPDSGLYSQEELDRMEELAEAYQAASEEYESTGSREAAIKMENLYGEAQALATTIYDNNGLVLTQQDLERDQIAAIRDNITATNNLTGALQSYYTSQEQSKGMAAGEKYGFTDAVDDSEYTDALMGHAAGLRRVPYDNYPALLHADERVLTAAEARAADQGGGQTVQVTVTGNSFVGTGEEMADQIMGLITEKLRLARMVG